MERSKEAIHLFKSQLENESQRIFDDNSLPKRGDALIWWYFTKLLGYDEGRIEDIVCDGRGELGLDAIDIDEHNVVHFYQFKHPIKIEASLKLGDVTKTINGLTLILEQKHEAVANERLKARVKDIHQIVRDGYVLHLVSSGAGLPENCEAEVSLNALINKWGGSPNSPIFSWRVEDISSLWNIFYRKNLPTVEENLEFENVTDTHLAHSSVHECHFFHTTGITLARMFDKHGELLLQQNIRLSEGETSTNTSIYHACTNEDSSDFLYYNNGVTFLCEDGVHHRVHQKFILTKAQIVNGGQTTRVLHKAFKDDLLKEDVKVSIRVITSKGNKTFGNNVTVNLNNQNAIKSSFLRSNDPHIVQLAHALLSLGWYLEKRECEAQILSDEEKLQLEKRLNAPLEKRIIPLEEGTKAYVSTFMRKPEIAKKFPKQMFAGALNNGYFEVIFNRDLRAEDFVISFQLKKLVDKFIKEVSSLKQRKARGSNCESDYKKMFGSQILKKHGEAVDQITPSGAEFLCATLFEYAKSKGATPEELLDELQTNKRVDILHCVDAILTAAKKIRGSGNKRWTSLFQTQHFFETVVKHL